MAAKSWVRIGQSLQDQMIFSMILDRTRKGVIYLGAGRHPPERRRWDTWSTLNKGLATLNMRSLVQSATDPEVFYVGTNGSGLYRSKNAGETWEPMPPVVPHIHRRAECYKKKRTCCGPVCGLGRLEPNRRTAEGGTNARVSEGSIRPRSSKLEPTVESEMLDPTVDRWSDEPTAEDDSLLSVDSPIEGPSPARGADRKPCRAAPADVRLFFGRRPDILAGDAFGSDCVPVFGVFPILGPAAGAMPIFAPVFGPVDSFDARISFSIESSISGSCGFLVLRLQSRLNRGVLVKVPMCSSVARSFFRSALAFANGRDHFVGA